MDPRERMLELRKLCEAILAKAGEEKRSLTPEERDELSGYRAEMETCKADIEAADELRSLAGWMDATPEPVSRMEIKERPLEPFKNLGEQLRAVIMASVPGGHIDRRLIHDEVAETRAGTGLNEAFPGMGGFLVDTDFSYDLLTNTMETGLLASRCRRMTIGPNSNGIKLPMIKETSRASTRAGGVLAYWKDEGALKVASKPEFQMLELELKKLIGLVYMTDELMADVTALESFVRLEFAKEFGFQIDDAIIRGTGAGQPLGILAAPALVTVSKEVGQLADTVVAENVMKMRSRMPFSSRPTAVWLINQALEPQLQSMSLAVGTGGVPVYMPMNGLSERPYDTLFGSPVLPIEQCSAIGDLGDIIYADFGQYLLVEKGGMESASSIHVNFKYDETVLRFVLRIDGQPIPSSALTPYLGGATATLSPFVVLEAR